MRWMLAALMLYAGLLPAQDIDLRLTPTGPEVLGTVDIVNAGDGSNRLFLVQQIGRIQVLRNGTLDPQPFLDIVDRVGSDGNEQGLLSAVFPPGFAQKRWFYVYYTDRTGRSQLDRYRLDAAGRGDPASRESILSFAQPFSNHNGGKLLFGPDGIRPAIRSPTRRRAAQRSGPGACATRGAPVSTRPPASCTSPTSASN